MAARVLGQSSQLVTIISYN